MTKLITTNSDDDDDHEGDDDHDDDKGDDDEGDDHDDEGDDDQVRTTERRFTWDKMNGIAQILSLVTNGQETNLVYGYNRALALQASKSSYFSYDAYGSAISKDGKDLSISKDFDIWGYSKNENQSIGFGYRAELHLGDDIYLRDRLYDPLTKRFVTKDKLSGIEGQTTLSNPYHYADNDPINKIDPMGLSPMTDDDVQVMGTTTVPSYPSTGTTSLPTTTTQQGSNKSKSGGGYYAAAQTGDDERNQFGCLIDWPDGNRPYLRSRTFEARCAGGTHTYWAIVVGEVWGPPPRYSHYSYLTPSARLTC